MEELSKHLLFLAAYHLIFFRKFYLNPWLNSTGEMLSTFFPVTLWQGRMWRRLKPPLFDSIYYYEPGSIPFLSTFYPLQIAVSMILPQGKLDVSFRIYQAVLLAHYFLASVLAYFLFLPLGSIIALFGAVTFAYMASSVKIQESCIVYSVCWLPGALLGGWVGMLCYGMAVLGGYWPLVIPFSILVAIMSPESLFGVFLAIPQILLFLNYYPRSIRVSHKQDHKFGRVPAWKFLDLFFGDRRFMKINDLFPFEMAMYIGVIPMFLLPFTEEWVTLGIGLVAGLASMFYSPFRIPARSLHLFNSCLVIAAVSGLSHAGLNQTFILILLFVQGYMLLKNADMYPLHPFAEPCKKPSVWLKGGYTAKFPTFTGYYHDRRTKGYTGGFCLTSTAIRNGVTDPNGEAIQD